MVLKMKTGDKYDKWYGPTGFNTELKRLNNGKGFSGVPSFIRHLQNNKELSFAYHVFYDDNVPHGDRPIWNEFEGISRVSVLQNWENNSWLTSSTTETIHEILYPDDAVNHPQRTITSKLTKRLIVGVLRAKNIKYRYVFLGQYELNEIISKNVNGYDVDATFFPLKACKMNSNIITYPHQVWKRVSDEWGE